MPNDYHRDVRPSLSFSRHEIAGAFGDLGTDMPLLVGVVLATGMDAPAAFVAFGLLQILSGLAYRLPMPVQPLKAMAAITSSPDYAAIHVHRDAGLEGQLLIETVMG